MEHEGLLQRSQYPITSSYMSQMNPTKVNSLHLSGKKNTPVPCTYFYLKTNETKARTV
jgi:hypothetical protein